MRNVLIATDFSENAWNATTYALQLLRDEKCTFHLLHTYTPAAYAHYDADKLGAAVGRLGTKNDPVYVESREGLRSVLERIMNECPNNKHDYDVDCAYNLLADEIDKVVAERKIDMIVVGIKGTTRTNEVLLGSDALYIMQRATCPVLAVPEDYCYFMLKDILFPSDYNHPYTEEHIKILAHIAGLYKASVHMFHIANEPALSHGQQRVRDMINDNLVEAKHDFKKVPRENVAVAIADYIAKNNIDMLAMTLRKHSFLELLLRRHKFSTIGLHSSVPLLVLPAK